MSFGSFILGRNKTTIGTSVEKLDNKIVITSCVTGLDNENLLFARFFEVNACVTSCGVSGIEGAAAKG